jgi:hypothetical protein
LSGWQKVVRVVRLGILARWQQLYFRKEFLTFGPQCIFGLANKAGAAAAEQVGGLA